MEYEYDVALSFAGEERDYVSEVAKRLHDRGIYVFYDDFEKVPLWGKDLGQHLDPIYREKAAFFVPFISKSYKEKIWPRYEFRNALSRAIESDSEYILPARFDDTVIPGIRPSISYIDLRHISLHEFVDTLIQKILTKGYIASRIAGQIIRI